MSNNINNITNLSFTTSIFEDNILDQLVFNTSTNRVFIFTVNLTSYINNISKCWECLSGKKNIAA